MAWKTKSIALETESGWLWWFDWYANLFHRPTIAHLGADSFEGDLLHLRHIKMQL
jgi:hypothetical protein